MCCRSCGKVSSGGKAHYADFAWNYIPFFCILAHCVNGGHGIGQRHSVALSGKSVVKHRCGYASVVEPLSPLFSFFFH
jgi:hypothetical protein